MKNLVIVESPTKAKTITKFLPDNYTVVSSYGHVRDLPKTELGVDTENNFEPKYIIPTKARKKVGELKKESKDKNVILATDGDREGEAISWHLVEALGLTEEKTKRIEFHEITKEAIEKALKNPRKINMDLVNAQQARRILDRLVGYKLSPFLWKKVVKGLSAGRVQSVAVRIIVEREREIQKFKPEEYWSIVALLNKDKEDFEASLNAVDGKNLDKLEIKNKKEAQEILENLNNAEWKVSNLEQKEHRRNPLPPFTTSSLQQTAWSRLHYPAKRTMMLAQNLYERGLITYHRTDSLNVSSIAIGAAREYIENEFGKNYIPDKPRFYKTRSKGAQEAHEAIRPTSPQNNPEKLKLEGPQKKLYTLIWQRFVSSQMEPAIFDAATVDVKAKNHVFRANGQLMRFDGFLRVYPIKFEEAELPLLKVGDNLNLKKITPGQHFTKPPARYNEASLVKALEKHEIGRPSTYASIISTIQERNYVFRNDQRQLEPNEIGFVVNDILVEHFPDIVDIDFTAKMENQLDRVAHEKEDWTQLLHDFYKPFEKTLKEKYGEVKKANMVKETDKKCPKCGKNLLKRMGRFGWFYGCSGFPECKHTEPLKENPDLKVHCPKCAEGEVVEKRTRRKKIFYGCSRYPDCDFALWDKPHIEKVKGTTKNHISKCPKCSSVLVEKKNGISCSNRECSYEKKD
ncbi:MAG: type I DNA topoisomerase [Candidatus Spechtbacterales bacterium]